jgi:hypothetical protein
VKINCWYSNGSPSAFHDFCLQNHGKIVLLKLINQSDLVRGTIYRHNIDSDNSKGICILLTLKAIHPAFFCLEDIESLHAERAANEAAA